MKASGLAETSCRRRRCPYSRTFARRQLLSRGARACHSCSYRLTLQQWRAVSRVLFPPLGLGSLIFAMLSSCFECFGSLCQARRISLPKAHSLCVLCSKCCFVVMTCPLDHIILRPTYMPRLDCPSVSAETLNSKCP